MNNNLIGLFPRESKRTIDRELPQGMVSIGEAAGSLVEKLRQMRAENAKVIPFPGSRIKGPPLKRTVRS